MIDTHTELRIPAESVVELAQSAFVAIRVRDESWVIELCHGDNWVGRNDGCAVRIDAAKVVPRHLNICWHAPSIRLQLGTAPVHLNGKKAVGSTELRAGDELQIGAAQLVVGLAVPPCGGGRRVLTHAEFRERLYEEVARATRGGRTTGLVMVQARPTDGKLISSKALESFRAGDVVATYAPDELEFLLPDTNLVHARAVVSRLFKSAGVTGARVGLAIAPGHGENPERLLRAARRALGAADPETGMGTPPNSPVSAPVRLRGTSERFVPVLERIGNKKGSVLVVGELSSGKAHFGRLLHATSARALGPFIVVDCATLDAAASVFEGTDNPVVQAISGTLLLDQIGDLGMSHQVALERLLQQHPEVSVVSTTHRALRGLVERGAFLPDLFIRLSDHTVEIPPLRNRPADLLPLARRFAIEAGATAPVLFSAGALARLRAYPWLGNVLELRNAMERAVRIAQGGEILAEHLPSETLAVKNTDGGLREHVDSVERDAIVKALADSNFNQTRSAKRLGLSRRALIYKMEKYGLKPPPASARRSQSQLGGKD